VARLAELRLAALEDRIEAELRLGRGPELTTELASLVASIRCGTVVGALMRALVAAGGRPSAHRLRRARAALPTSWAPTLAGALRVAHRGAARRGRPNPGTRGAPTNLRPD